MSGSHPRLSISRVILTFPDITEWCNSVIPNSSNILMVMPLASNNYTKCKMNIYIYIYREREIQSE